MSTLHYIPDGSDAEALHHFELYNTFQMLLVLAGCGATFYFMLRIADIVCDLWFRKSIPVESFGAGEGYWAVVTGCTDGIGKELALQLGEKGYNLVLLSRTQNKLDTVRDQLLAMGVEVDAYAVDFSKTTKEQWDHIQNMVMTKKIGILVNNVGVCHPTTATFIEESPSVCKQMIDVNIVTMMNMTRYIVPQMRARKNGCILNIGSWTSMRAMPFLSVYAGTKGFVKTFSQSLAYELKPEGITVEHVFSFWVSSKMSGYKTASISIPSAETYVRAVLTHIGRMCGTLEGFSTVPYPPHSYLAFVACTMWDSRITPPILFSIANNLYKLSEKKRQKFREKQLTLLAE
ncbi:NAD(P)-binding protein [Martensiomyces pterosporus]|nr:NAD(P)-binding protein [Martensiomyces pterosporus]